MSQKRTNQVALNQLISFARREAIDQAHDFTAYLLGLAEESLKPDNSLTLQNTEATGFNPPRQQRLN